MFKILIISIAVSVIGVHGQQSAYGQCGGKSWTGTFIVKSIGNFSLILSQNI